MKRRMSDLGGPLCLLSDGWSLLSYLAHPWLTAVALQQCCLETQFFLSHDDLHAGCLETTFANNHLGPFSKICYFPSNTRQSPFVITAKRQSPIEREPHAWLSDAWGRLQARKSRFTLQGLALIAPVHQRDNSYGKAEGVIRGQHPMILSKSSAIHRPCQNLCEPIPLCCSCFLI